MTQLLRKGHSRTELHEKLSQEGFSHEHLLPEVERICKCYYEGQRKRGFLLLGIGALFCVLGFVVVIFSSNHDALFKVGMYGFTTLGTMLVMAGLMYIMG